MNQKLVDNAALILLFTPAFSAVIKIFISFSMFDLIYLILVGIIFLRCYLIERKHI